MPKGQYDRTKAKARDAAAPGEPGSEPAPKKRRKQRRKARASAVVPVPAPNGEAKRFDVSLDLRGGAVTIHAANGSLTLAPDEVGALFGFMRGR